jgi:CheY-like chemotaxis protein
VILTIDDDPLFQELMTDMLICIGLQSMQAENGEQGLELFQRHRSAIRAVVLDMQMPVMGGLETFRRLRLLDGKIPIIFYSADDLTSLHHTYREDWAVQFLEKSCRTAHFIATIQKALTKSPTIVNVSAVA